MPLRCSTMLAMLAQSGSGDSITLDEILSRFRSRAYGVLLMLVLLPAFLPLPIGAGAVSGPLVSALGMRSLFTGTGLLFIVLAITAARLLPGRDAIGAKRPPKTVVAR